jgi:adenylosuccinate lyase
VAAAPTTTAGLPSAAERLAITQAGMSREDTYRAVQRVAMPVFDGKGRFRDLIMVDKEVMRYVSPERLDAGVRRYLSH